MAAKRKPGIREPNGRIKRPSKAEREEFARRMEQAEMQTVLVQPHRKGSTDQLLESALGRFVLRLGLRREFYDAGLEYGTLKRKWRSGWGAPRLEDIPGNGGDIPMDVLHGWAAQISRIELAVAQSPGRLGLGPIQWALDLNLDIKRMFDRPVSAALLEIAVELGKFDRKEHPFKKTA